MKNRYILVASIFVFCFGTAGIAPRTASAKTLAKATIQPKFSVFLRTELFFGLDKSTGGQVSSEDWEKIVAEVVTPRFPNGLTVDDALGQYLDGKIFVREKSKRLILIYPRKYKTPQDERSKRFVRHISKSLTKKSVLRVDLPHVILVHF